MEFIQNFNMKVKHSELAQFKYHQIILKDDIRGLVLATKTDGINEAARDQASRQQLLRVFVKFVKEDPAPMKLLPPKHVGVICDGLYLNFFFLHVSNLNIKQDVIDHQ